MKLGMGISPKVASVLRSLGHEAVRCSDIDLSTATDSAILAYAQEHNHILVSTDLDFADLLITCAEPCPGLILLRLDNPYAELMSRRLRAVLTALPKDDIAGSIVVIQQNKARTRKLYS